jgi:hypothetical protein
MIASLSKTGELVSSLADRAAGCVLTGSGSRINGSPTDYKIVWFLNSFIDRLAV